MKYQLALLFMTVPALVSALVLVVVRVRTGQWLTGLVVITLIFVAVPIVSYTFTVDPPDRGRRRRRE